VLLRYIELRSRLYRLISILKVRDGSFNPLLHEFALTEHGLAIEPSSDSAEAIMAGFARLPEGLAPPGVASPSLAPPSLSPPGLASPGLAPLEQSSGPGS